MLATRWRYSTSIQLLLRALKHSQDKYINHYVHYILHCHKSWPYRTSIVVSSLLYFYLKYRHVASTATSWPKMAVFYIKGKSNSYNMQIIPSCVTFSAQNKDFEIMDNTLKIEHNVY